jgi:hypothetical protein
MTRASAEISEIKLPQNNWMRFRCDDGNVCVSAPSGATLTNERALWLLEKAKQGLMGAGR